MDLLFNVFSYYVSSNFIIERAFKEVKRRTRVVGRFLNETSALGDGFQYSE